MSLVEIARERIKNPPPHSQITESRKQANALVRQFMGGEIGLDDLRKGLKLQETSDEIALTQPGPLAGLLIKLGFDRQTAWAIAEEEKAHFQIAKREGLNPRIILEFSKPEDEEEYPLEECLHVFVAYQVPEGIEPEEMRRIIAEIALAPKNPSEDDLAKLPSEKVIFPQN